MKIILSLFLIVVSAPALADDQARDEAFREIGFAIAAAKACPQLKVSSAGMRDMTASFDAADQVAIFTHSTNVQWATEDADKMFSLSGIHACEIAHDWLQKAKYKLLQSAK